MGRGVSAGGVQSSLGYLFGGGEAPAPNPSPSNPQAPPPTEAKASNSGVAPKPTVVSSPPADSRPQVLAGIHSSNANNYVRADGQNCGNFLTEEEKVDPSIRDLFCLMSDPTMVRNVALVGHLHHGKSLFTNMLIDDHMDRYLATRKYTDTRMDEICFKTRPVTLELKGSDLKPYICNLMDAPGHPDFSDEMSAALRLADGAVLIVDAADGVMVNTKRAIIHAIQEQLPIVLVINKVDKLIIELELAPEQAYERIRSLIDSVNTCITSTSSNAQLMDPVIGNVCFASALDDWSFTLQSFAKLYVKLHGLPFNPAWLWGDYYYDQNSGTIEAEMPDPEAVKSFVQLVLIPLYEFYNEATLLRPLLKLDSEPFSEMFEMSLSGFTDMLVHHIHSAKAAAAKKVEHIYTGPKNSHLYRAMESCDPNGRLMVNVTKLYPKPYDCVFQAFGRVYSGRIIKGQTVLVCHDLASADEDCTVRKQVVTELKICLAGCQIPINEAPPGSWVLIEGVDRYIAKTATLTSEGKDWSIFRPLQFNNTLPVVIYVIEPLNPRELHSMVRGLMHISKSYPSAVIKIEKSGKHTISGTGDLYMSHMMYDLNSLVKIRVTDRFVSLRKTVIVLLC